MKIKLGFTCVVTSPLASVLLSVDDDSDTPLVDVEMDGDDSLEVEGAANGEVTGLAAGVEGLGVVGTLVTGDGVILVGLAVGLAGASIGAEGIAPDASGINDEEEEEEEETDADDEEPTGREGVMEEVVAVVVVVVAERGSIREVTDVHVVDILELKPLLTVAATTKRPTRRTDNTTPMEASTLLALVVPVTWIADSPSSWE